MYLVSSNNELPDLLVDLRGQVEVYLRGVISSGSTGGLKTVFRKVPDVPVSKFVLKMKGGKKSLLVNSTNLCAQAAAGDREDEGPERQEEEQQPVQAERRLLRQEEGQEVGVALSTRRAPARMAE